MKIKLTSVYVDNQENALRFYTEVLGFVKKTDFSQGPYRWLTVASAEDPNGTELQLALNNNPAAKEYQQALFQQNQPAAIFFTDDVQADYERMKARGAEFTMPPKDVRASKIAMVKDTCGNLIQITQLASWYGREKTNDSWQTIHTFSGRCRAAQPCVVRPRGCSRTPSLGQYVGTVGRDCGADGLSDYPDFDSRRTP
jgi:predicted enzyme related to lactoylglutathione lyase